MKSYYYLRLCRPSSYLPLEEYIGQSGIIDNHEDLDALLTFDSREEAGEFIDRHCDAYPTRVIQICHHIEKSNSSTEGIIRQ